jgi:hypothetical protein
LVSQSDSWTLFLVDFTKPLRAKPSNATTGMQRDCDTSEWMKRDPRPADRVAMIVIISNCAFREGTEKWQDLNSTVSTFFSEETALKPTFSNETRNVYANSERR